VIETAKQIKPTFDKLYRLFGASEQ
jgi:hypothetical protein